MITMIIVNIKFSTRYFVNIIFIGVFKHHFEDTEQHSLGLESEVNQFAYHYLDQFWVRKNYKKNF